MRPSMIITLFISAAAALRCKGNRHPSVKELTVWQAQNTCGNDMTVQCCNKLSNKPARNAAGDGLGLLNDLTLVDGYSDLSLNVVGILDGLLGKKCGANVACCQNSPSTVK
ncbi:Rodlet protein [Fusarium oxysporum f. sp. rapae]|uniref:Hydrophobin n=1 Tax=Fusarium oxysporum f. sp. rapae TaxID=485398 RepID=A0A8J5NLW2_FUSOX|nr:Rodlet protein [Fusarium oxysporum f. sp. rapae]